MLENLDKSVMNLDLIEINDNGKISAIGDFIVCSSQDSSLQDLIYTISHGHYTMLTGENSRGKKRLMKNIALLLKYEPSEIITLKLGPHIDPRELVGQYVTTNSAQKFKWIPGLLARALHLGYFVILDGWDLILPEASQFFINLLDNKCLNCSNYGVIRPSDRFRLTSIFNTQNKPNAQSMLYNHRWKIFDMRDISILNMEFIVPRLYKSLTGLEDILSKIYNFARPYNYGSADFFRLCKHLSSELHITSDGLLKDPYKVTTIILNNLHSSSVNNKMEIFTESCKYLSVDPITAELKSAEIDENIAIESLSRSKDSSYYISQSNYKIFHILKTCIECNDPVLVIGDTGIGKTALIQCLAKRYGRSLDIINLGQHSDVTHLFGGVRLTKFSKLVENEINNFSNSFRFVNEVDNKEFIDHLYKYNNNCHFLAVVKALNGALTMLLKCLPEKSETIYGIKKRIKSFEKDIPVGDDVIFQEMLGILTKAVVEGHWILLDEINLAPNEILATISYILENQTLYLSCSLINSQLIKVHPNFRLFACMNPPNDVGKKVLPLSITKNFVKISMDEISTPNEIEGLIRFYIGHINDSLVLDCAKFYIDFKNWSLSSGGISPKIYSYQRALCRSLLIAVNNSQIGLSQALYESINICFLSNFVGKELEYWLEYLAKVFSKNVDSLVTANPGDIMIENYGLKRGSNQPFIDKTFVLTDTVKRKLKVLARIISMSNLPVLLEGDTAVGKTSLITYLSKRTGNSCVRINNHEHTEIQDYMGSYTIDSNGLFLFKEGPLIQAMRTGNWVILDELNLASSDVLETLNRLLDDNRELFIEETQEYIKAHANFRIFATQNPAGLYSGRKELSRAFRSRFIELDLFDLSDLKNIQTVIEKRFQLKHKVAEYMVKIMSKLTILRKSSNLFSGKYGFITIRDLIKWSSRIKHSNSNPSLSQIASIGYHLLSSRCRYQQDIDTVYLTFTDLLVGHKFSRNIEYSSPVLNDVIKYQQNSPYFKHLIWTKPLLQNAYYIFEGFKHGEPMLLIGETSSGKTTLCQLFAEATGRPVYIFNCHSNMESMDIIGRLTLKVINSKKVFLWEDGPLVQAMKTGGLFILDEISLADDSVLERINSLLESDYRALVLYEKTSKNETEVIIPHKNFLISATMNPTGDYGKRELSQALRNRFTEVWCNSSNSNLYYEEIIQFNLKSELLFFKVRETSYKTSHFILHLINFINKHVANNSFSIRKLLRSISFINNYTHKFLTVHPLVSSILDSFITVFFENFDAFYGSNIYNNLIEHVLQYFKTDIDTLFSNQETESDEFYLKYNKDLYCHYLCYPVVQQMTSVEIFEGCEEIRMNLNKITKAMLYNVQILLEGPPGCGKTLSVYYLAALFNKKLVRINFCEHTELSDILGSYHPICERGEIIFKWVNGPFIQAIIDGDWILLDEINLAFQTVLEGLNSCFDHRKSIYVSEIDQTFTIDPSKTKIFATQNPQSTLGRKGLPISFLDRFIVLNIGRFSSDTLFKICLNRYPHLSLEIIRPINEYIQKVTFLPLYIINIRDAFRMFEIISKYNQSLSNNISLLFYLVFFSKMRTVQDRDFSKFCYYQVFTQNIDLLDIQMIYSDFKITSHFIKIGLDIIDFPRFIKNRPFDHSSIRFIPSQYKYFGMISAVVQMGWPCLITGPLSTTKTTIVKALSMLYGVKLVIVSLTCENDVSDLIGDFDYCDTQLQLKRLQLQFVKYLQKLNINTDDLKLLLGESEKFNSKRFRSIVAKIMKNVQDLAGDEKASAILSKIYEFENTISDGRSDIPNIAWRDGLLVKCLRKGYWIVLDNINFCSPAIIDKLNCLLEPNGTLQINQNESITPNKNFRFFAIYDPHFGEVSHSLRNRCIEIYIDPSQTVEKLKEIDFNKSLKYPKINMIFEPDVVKNIIKYDYDVIETISNKINIKIIIKELLLIERGTLDEMDLPHRLKFIGMEHPESFYVDIKELINRIESEEISQFEYSLTNTQPQFLRTIYPFYLSRNNNFTYFQLCRIYLFLKNYLYQKYILSHIKESKNDPLPNLLENLMSHIFAFILSTKNTDLQTSSKIQLYLSYLFEMLKLSKSANSETLLMLWNNFYKAISEFCSLNGVESLLTNINKYLSCTESIFDPIYRDLYYSDYSIYFNLEQSIYDEYRFLINGSPDFLDNTNRIVSCSGISMSYLPVFKYVKSLTDVLCLKSFSDFSENISHPIFARLQKLWMEKLFKYNNGLEGFKSIYFTTISRYILGDFNKERFFHPFHIIEKNDVEYLKETLVKYDPIKLLDVYSARKFPFVIKCKDYTHFSQFIENKCICLWSNINVFLCWNEILSNLMRNLLKSIIFSHFQPFIPSLQDKYLEDTESFYDYFFTQLQNTSLFHVFKDEVYRLQQNINITYSSGSDNNYLIGDAYITLGTILLKIFGNLPTTDISNQDYYQKEFITNVLSEIDSELEVRLKLLEFYHEAKSFDFLARYDVSYHILTNMKDVAKSLYPTRHATHRSSIRYNQIKALLVSFVDSLEFNLRSDTANILLLIRDFRKNITNNYTEFSNNIEPILTALMIIEFGDLLRKIPQHEILPTIYQPVNASQEDYMDNFALFSLKSLHQMDIIIEKYKMNYFATKKDALKIFRDNITVIFDLIENILTKIESQNLLRISSFKIIQPEVKIEDFETPQAFKSDNFSNSTKNPQSILLFISKISYEVFEKLRIILSFDSCFQPTIDTYSYSNFFDSLCLSSNIDQIHGPFLLNKSFKDTINYNVTQNENIYEYGYPSYSFKISQFLKNVLQCVDSLKLEYNTSVLDEIVLSVNQLGELNISSPLITFLNMLDHLYRLLLSLQTLIPKNLTVNEIIDEIKCLIITIRKEQFECWPHILTSYNKKSAQNNCLIFTNIFKVVEKLVTSDVSEFPIFLKSFIETQVLGTYDFCLQTLSNILTLLSYLYPSSKHIAKYLNLIDFYFQFDQDLLKYKEKQISPILTELSEFSKISRWRDFNYWSMKESSMKAHRTLHKHISKYQTIMNQPLSHILKTVRGTFGDINILTTKYTLLEPCYNANVYPVDSEVNLSFDTLKISLSISNKFINKMDDALSYFTTVCEKLNSMLKSYGSTKIQSNNEDTSFETVLDEYQFSTELMSLGLFDSGTHSLKSDSLSNFDVFDGIKIHLIQNPELKDLCVFNNTKYMNCLHLLDKTRIQLFKIDLNRISRTKITNVLDNFYGILFSHRSEIKELFVIHNNIQILKTYLHEISGQDAKIYCIDQNAIRLSREILFEISHDLKSFFTILQLKPNIADTYYSPYFPNIRINHETLNDSDFIPSIIKKLNVVILQTLKINSELGSLGSRKYILQSKLDEFKDKIHLLMLSAQQISERLECLTMYNCNYFTDTIKKAVFKLSEVIKIFSQFVELSQLYEDSVNDVYITKIQKFVYRMLRGYQTLKNSTEFMFPSLLDYLNVIKKAYSYHNKVICDQIVDGFVKIGDNSLNEMVCYLVNNQCKIFDESLIFFLKTHCYSLSLYYSILTSINTSISSYAMKSNDQTTTQASNQQENTDEPAQIGGFHDGKGHDDVTDQIPDEDILEKAVPESELYNTQDDNNSTKESCSSNEISDEGIELSDDITNDFNEITGKLDPEDNDSEVEDKMSSGNPSICNDLDPEIWNKDISDTSDNEEIQTEKDKINTSNIDKDLPDEDIDQNAMGNQSEVSEKELKEHDSHDDALSTRSGDEMNSISDGDEDVSINKEKDEEINKQDEEMLNPANSYSDHINGNSLNFPDTTLRNDPNCLSNGNDNNDKTDTKDIKMGLNSECQQQIVENDENAPQADKHTDKNSDNSTEKLRKRHLFDKNEIDTVALKIKKCNVSESNNQNNENSINVGQSADAEFCENLQDAEFFSCEPVGDSSRLENIENTVDHVDNINPSENQDQIDTNEIISNPMTKSEIVFSANTTSFKNLPVIIPNNLPEEYISKKTAHENNENPIFKNDEEKFLDLYTNSHHMLACNLCEKLKMILEPTKKNKFNGNFRSGKKLNIRKIIPYIASKYTRDKIWMKRNRPSNREYQVIIAIDDSASMRDNNSRKIALESLLTISTAFQLLEIGKVAILSFGATVETLLDFSESVSDDKKQEIWNNLKFCQKTTNFISLLQTCSAKFKSLTSNSDATLERLCIIISDGRGIYSHGESLAQNSVKELVEQNVLTIFIILDSNDLKQSITQINVPQFDPKTGSVSIKSYLEVFPFPYYIILRDINHLPDYMCSIIQQWMQLFNE